MTPLQRAEHETIISNLTIAEFRQFINYWVNRSSRDNFACGCDDVVNEENKDNFILALIGCMKLQNITLRGIPKYLNQLTQLSSLNGNYPAAAK